PDGYVNSAYSFTPSTSGGKPPLSFSASGLPTGLSVNSSTGAISGTPSASGGFTAAVTVTDGSGLTANQTFAFHIYPPLLLASASPQDGYTGSSYSYAMAGSGGKVPLTYSASGLPTGLSINSSSGVISGTPSAAGAFTATVTVADVNGKSASQTPTFNIYAP